MATPAPDGIAAGQRNVALKAFDQWLHIAAEDASVRKIYATWFD
jgi:hypothetical protein